jgi:hypothetical protein
MTNPRGSNQTVRNWDKNGLIGASLQIEKFPPNDITGVLKDRDMLVLTTTLLENGKPIWAVISLTLDGERMTMAQNARNESDHQAGYRQEADGLNGISRPFGEQPTARVCEQDHYLRKLNLTPAFRNLAREADPVFLQ